MKKILTARQIEQAKFPTRLEVYRERDKRNALTPAQKQELYRLEQGHLGEQAVLSLIEEHGEDHWTVLSNIWLYEYGKFEIDLLLVTYTDLHAFEIKNYDSDFEYKNSLCKIDNDIVISQNPISQAQRANINFQNLLRYAGLDIDVHGALIFTGPHCDVKIHSPIEDLSIHMLHQLRKHIRKISAIEKEKLNNGVPLINKNQLISVIEKNEIETPYLPEVILENEHQKMKRGILCANCGSFDLDTSRSYITCNCGMHEPREMAIVRTICEYGIIHFDKDLTTAEVTDFFGGDFVKSTIVKYLNTYFEKVGSKRGTKYLNKREDFETILPSLPFKKSRFITF